jgi:Arylsulfotransferase (ASST)
LRKLGLSAVVSALGVCVCLAAVALAAKPGAYTTRGAFSFVSAPRLHPPKIPVFGKTSYRKLAPGLFFEAPAGTASGGRMVGQSGPLMLDSHLQPVWFLPVPVGKVASSLKLQSYLGKPALSWWEGVTSKTGITTSGELELVDQHYHQIAKITGKDGWTISLHDAVVQGTSVWVTAYKQIPGQNLKPYHGSSSGTLYDAAVQQYDIKTGALLSSWDAQAHVPLADSHAPVIAKQPWDAYHLNSIQLVGSGQMLISMRNTWAAYLVDLNTGSIVWSLGGKHSTFKFQGKAQFHWQHDVELHRSNVVSVFDDACCAVKAGGLAKQNGVSRGLVLRLNMSKHTASEVSQYTLFNYEAAFLGNTQLLSDGNVSIGWGSQPHFTEYSKTGKLLINAKWPGSDESYRSYVERWVGLPDSPPSGAVRTRSGKTTVYASWNGATQVAKWEVLGGASSKKLKVLARASRSGFETAISLTKTAKVYEVVALDSHGHKLGNSSFFPHK